MNRHSALARSSARILHVLLAAKARASRRAVGIARVLALLALTPAQAHAQSPTLTQILFGLFEDVQLEPPAPGFPSHATDFLPTRDDLFAPFVFTQSITAQLPTFPVAASSGGFTYRFDQGAGVFTRSSSTFGPAFADRATTRGKGRGGAGLSFQRSSYRSFDGRDLAGGDIKFYLTHRPTGTNSSFEGDLIEQSLDLSLSTNIVTFFADYGITDRLDVAVVAPFVAVELDAAVRSKILRLASGEASLVHRFANNATERVTAERGSAAGPGDVLLRTKYRLVDLPDGGVATTVDLRLPTGDHDNLLGAGTAQARFAIAISRAVGRLAPHVNLGFTVSGKPDVGYDEDEINYAAGLELAATPRVTIVADVLTRSLRDSFRFNSQTAQHTFRSTAGVPGVFDFVRFAPVPANVNLRLAAAGVKVNPVANALISFNLLVPFGSAGLRATVTPVVSFDYSF